MSFCASNANTGFCLKVPELHVCKHAYIAKGFLVWMPQLKSLVGLLLKSTINYNNVCYSVLYISYIVILHIVFYVEWSAALVYYWLRPLFSGPFVGSSPKI